MAARPPAKLVEPTLVTRARGMLLGSITTSGRWAWASAARSSAVSAFTTVITAWRPASARSRAQPLPWYATIC